ncbi:regulatory GntR family protein [Paraburkholderia sp. BL25I1N1]|nr:regulatory GntR family protein [Paraburkholderia sp. BL25I1N1]
MHSNRSIATQILELFHSERLHVGGRLPAQMLGDRLRVSHSPVNDALALPREKGVLTRERNRGFFVARSVTESLSVVVSELSLPVSDAIAGVYFCIADDARKGLLADEFPEQLCGTRYGLTGVQATAVPGRIVHEGWAGCRPGYGWRFPRVLTTPDSLRKSYRLRLAPETAALPEPGNRLDPRALPRCRVALMAASRPIRRTGCTIAATDFTSRSWKRQATRFLSTQSSP